MKRILTIAALVLATFTKAAAAPGDTIKVQAQSGIWMDHYGNFDSTIEFPDGTKSYRKVMMTFTLGRYACPGNPQYCGDWDYTVQTLLMTKTGDTLELGRLISPYAGDGWPRTSTSWKQRYEFDVTDFYPLLKDSATIRIHYSGYSWGFTANVKFDFIEGTPPRNVLGIDKLWHGSYSFGDGNAPIDNNVTSYTKSAPANTQFTDMKFIITGHGSDDMGCSEFCKKYYRVNLNKALGPQTDIWRADCGYNHMYPQNGTWVHDRGNWCPGDKVFTNVHPLGVQGGSSYEIDVDFEAYTGTLNRQGASRGSYIIGAAAFYYGAFNKTKDASLDDIIAPSNHETHFRYNPFTGKPLVRVRNEGSDTIKTIRFKYEVAGGTGAVEYTWQGSLAPLASAEIELGPLFDLRKITSSGNKFNVEIVEVNGATDADATNNKMSSVFEPALQLPLTSVVELVTNSATVNGVSETSWKIVDAYSGNTVVERKNCTPNTPYSDTVKLTVGMYKLVVEDAGCDGLYWWANQNAGAGTLDVKRPGNPFPESLTGYFSGDFGCGFTQYFNVDWPAGISNVESISPSINVYPNPAQGSVTVTLYGLERMDGVLLMKDITGKVVTTQKAAGQLNTIDVSKLANGVYMLEYANDTQGKLKSKVIIAR